MRSFIALSLLAVGCTALPFSSIKSSKQAPDYVDPDYYYEKALNTPLVLDVRVKAPRDNKSPSAASALAYMKHLGADADDLCGKTTKTFLETILSGGAVEKANAEATKVYIVEYNAGSRPEAGSACDASVKAWMEAEKSGKDPIVESALAFMRAHPNVKNGNPCAVSGVSYVFAILEGKSHTDANLAAVSSFVEALLAKARNGEELRDPACAQSTKAFFEKLEGKPSKPNAAAMVAFIDKAFNTEKFEYDPICWRSTKVFIESYKKGNDELTSNLAAAEAFLDEFAKGSTIPADSPCAAATRAYYANIPNLPSPPNKAAMEAFMDKMIGDGARTPDPVCAISTKAYWQAYKNGATELEANLAAAEAFFTEYIKGSSIPADSPCAAATRAYWQNIENAPSPANKAAMEAFMNKIISNGNVRAQDPVCDASVLAYWNSWKAGDGELDSNLAAAEAFFEEFGKGSKLSADSPCAAATRAYYANIPNAPSPPNKAAMDAFMNKMIGDGARTPDPVCAAATRAYWEAYKQGKSEVNSNLAAAEAFLTVFESGLSIPSDSPCAASTKAYYAALENPPSPANKAAMETFMNKMIGDGKRSSDHACAASLKGYFEAHKSGLSETRANLAAAEAFLNAYNNGLDIPADSACVAATKTYYANLKNKPSGPNAEAMISFIDHMVSNGNRRVFDPVCASATQAYFQAYKNGESELNANLKAAKAFFGEYKKGAKVPADSACAAATKIYLEQIKSKPSPANSVAMTAFMEEAIKSGLSEMDPVCAASAEAYFDAYLLGVGEAKANEAAGVAFLNAAKNSNSYSPKSPCGQAAEAFMKNY